MRTDWLKLYLVAAGLGAALGILLALGALPAAPAWPAALGNGIRAWPALLYVLGGVLVGLALAAVAHLGVLWQLRRARSRRGGSG